MATKKKGGAKSKSKKKAAAEASVEHAGAETTGARTTETNDAPVAESNESKREATNESDRGPTLSDAASKYLVWLDNDGAGLGTLSSYRGELQLAMREIGEDTLLSELTVERVQEFFDSDAVMLTRSGKPKAKPTFDKTRRVLRLALVWAANEKLIESAPIPATASRIVKLAAV